MAAIFDLGPPEPCPTSFNMAAYVMAHAGTQPDKIALSIVGLNASEDWTYHALERAILGTAQGFLDLGLTPGDRILMRLGNTVHFPICFLAAIAVGLVPVPTSAMLTNTEVGKLAVQLQPKLVVAAPGIACPDPDMAPQLSLTALQTFQNKPPAQYLMGDANRLAYIIYTSGTSGRPTAVCHAHRAIWARRMMWQGWYDLKPDDRVMHAGAFNWTYTLGTGLMDPWTMGATALIPDQNTTAQDLPGLIKSEHATIFAAAPGVYRQMLKSPRDAKFPHLRHGLSAGEKLPGHTRHMWQAATGTQVYEAFGMSECSTFVSSSPTQNAAQNAGHHDSRPAATTAATQAAMPAPAGAMGKPQTGRRVAVLGPDHSPVAFDAPGEFAITQNDQGLMLGYLGGNGQIGGQIGDRADDRFAGEWFLTGDTVSMAQDGAITYLGRADDMMNAGGFRVSPIDVEQTLIDHPDIEDCAVVEVTVKKHVSVIAAFYVAKHDLSDREFSTFTTDRLARYKTPRIYVRLGALPRSANGKLLRKTLRKNYEAQHGQS